MTKTIWYIFKPGDVRDFATPTPPNAEWGASLHKEGFRVVEVTFEVPQELLGAAPDAAVTGTGQAPKA